ncbi:arsenate reductase (glutaredoxin) [Minwuia sp.]|uniref:arsenate reductase (glutaredoxin) n=1 Tax=Minwuia sp. TaxID=2493630 RepID=UPI003A8D8A97
MDVTIYHNPRCSKSRQTLELLREKGIEPSIIEYLKTPPSAPEIADILAKLNRTPRELMRVKEPEYKEQGLNDAALDDGALINAMVATPKLMERPIVLANGRAAVGRPPEDVLKIL